MQRQSLTLTIQGMHCGACVRRVTQALQAVPGVHAEAVQLGEAKVTYDPAVAEPDTIAQAVDKIGFVVTQQA